MKISFSSNISATIEEGNYFLLKMNIKLNNRRRSPEKNKKIFNYNFHPINHRFYFLFIDHNIRRTILQRKQVRLFPFEFFGIWWHNNNDVCFTVFKKKKIVHDCRIFIFNWWIIVMVWQIGLFCCFNDVQR